MFSSFSFGEFPFRMMSSGMSNLHRPTHLSLPQDIDLHGPGMLSTRGHFFETFTKIKSGIEEKVVSYKGNINSSNFLHLYPHQSADLRDGLFEYKVGDNRFTGSYDSDGNKITFYYRPVEHPDGEVMLSEGFTRGVNHSKAYTRYAFV